MGVGSGLAIAGGIGAAASLGGAAISSNAAGNAASDQSNAAEQAAQLQYQASQNALGFQEQEYNQGQSNLAPWLQSGAGALGNLDYLLGISPPTTQGTMAGGALTPNSAQTGAPGQTSGTGSGLPGATTGTPAMPRGVSQTQVPQGSQGQPLNPGGTNTGAQTYNFAQGAPQATGTVAQPTAGQPGAAQGTSSLRPVGTVQPSLNTGATGTTNLGSTVNPSLGGFGSLMQAYPGGPFVAPTADQAMQSPGTQAALQLGDQSVQASAAARGSLLTGGTAKALDTFGQQLGSQNYQNVYNNAYNTYASGYNQYQQQQANQYNRLASLAGVGQQTAGQLGTLGQNAASGITSNLLNTASNIGQQTNNAAAANASGVVGSANAWSGALGGTSSSLSNLLSLQQLYGSGAGTSGIDTGAGGASNYGG